MRFFFDSLTRPKRVAKDLQFLLPTLPLARCQLITARIYGYRDWRDLEETTRTGGYPPSSDDEDLAMEDCLIRARFHTQALEKALEIDIEDASKLASQLAPTSRSRHGVTKSRPGIPDSPRVAYRHLLADLSPGEQTGSVAANNQGRHGQYVAYIDAAPGQTAEAFAQAFIAGMGQGPYRHFDEDALQAFLHLASYQVSRFDFEGYEYPDVEGDGMISQTCLQRMALYRNDVPIGFLVLGTELMASRFSDADDVVRMTVLEAWAPEMDREAWETLIVAAALSFSGWAEDYADAYIGNKPTKLPELQLVTQSEHLYRNDFLGIVEAITRDFLNDRGRYRLLPDNIQIDYEL